MRDSGKATFKSHISLQLKNIKGKSLTVTYSKYIRGRDPKTEGR